MVDNFCQSLTQKERRRPGPDASLSPSEVVTLAIFARWGRFASERDFYRYADAYLRNAFPTLPDRSQFNRLVRLRLELIEDTALHLATLLGARRCPYEALDSSAMPIRDAKRRGEGWLAGQADIGWSNSLGWYEGFRLLVSCDPRGVITGFGFASASTKDQPLAETFFAVRAQPSARLLGVWGLPPRDRTWSTRALRAPKIASGGCVITGRGSSARPSAMPLRYGRSA
jgi:hypothetical protein